MSTETTSKIEERFEKLDERLQKAEEQLTRWKYIAAGVAVAAVILGINFLSARTEIDRLQQDVSGLQKQTTSLKTDVATLQAATNDVKKFFDNERESQQRKLDEYVLSKRNEFNDGAKNMQVTYVRQLDDHTLIKRKELDAQVVTATLGIQTQVQQILSRVTQVEGNLNILSREALRSGNRILVRSLRFDTCVDSAEQAPNLVQLIDCKDVPNQTWILLRK